MRVVTIDEVEKISLGEAVPVPGWEGGSVSREQQPIIPDGDSDNYRCSIVHFSKGATTGWHAHDNDQILVVTSGSGIVATEDTEYEINVGDVAHIKAGEKHWHGAKADTEMAHLTVTIVGSNTAWFDQD